MAIAAGIDFGTSNTAVSLAINGEIRPVVVDTASAIAATIPTLLYFPPTGSPSYGTEAINRYLSSDMAGRLLQSIKRYLPSSTFQGTVVGGRNRGLEELIGGFLARCKAAIDAAAGEPVTRVLLGRPAVLHVDPERDAMAERRLVMAARMAGFQQIQVQLEPIAAARAFERTLDQDTLCMIGDLGGGTSDFTVIRLGPGRVGARDRSGDVLGSAGVDVAGNDVDARLIQHRVLPYFGVNTRYRPLKQWVPLPTFLHMAATRWHRLCVEGNLPENIRFLDRAIRTAEDVESLERFREFLTRNYGYSLFQAIESAKIALSQGTSTRLVFKEGGVELDEPLSRDDLERDIKRELEQLSACIDGLLSKLSVERARIGAVFLTGGTSQIPAVQDLFHARFPGRIASRDAFTSVGLGLGVEAAERFG